MTHQINPRMLLEADVADISEALFEGIPLIDLREEFIERGTDLTKLGASPLPMNTSFQTSEELGATLLDALGTDLVLDETIAQGLWTWCSLYAAEALSPMGQVITPRKEANRGKFVPEKGSTGNRKGRVYVRSMARIVLEARTSGRIRDRLLCMHPSHFNNRVIQHIVGGTGRFSLLRHPLLLDLLEELYVKRGPEGYAYADHSSTETHIDGLVHFLQEIDQTYCIDVMDGPTIAGLLPAPYQKLLPPTGTFSTLPAPTAPHSTTPPLSGGFYAKMTGLLSSR